jgi:hypothetical protein
LLILILADIFSTFSYFLHSQSPLKPVKMKKNETPVNKHAYDFPEKQGPKILSRRKVIKSLMLIPIQIGLFQSLIKAQGATSLFSGVKYIPGDNHPGISGNSTEDLYAPNQPMGKGQGIIPGQVSWVWNPAATNPSCANLPVSAELSEDKYDAWFMDRNTSQDIVDRMLADGLCSISGHTKTSDAWNRVRLQAF